MITRQKIEKVVNLEGLGCADCAAQMEEQINQLEGIEEANLNFVAEKLKLRLASDQKWSELKESIQQIINQIEPEVKVSEAKSGDDMFSSEEKEGANFKSIGLRLGLGSSLFICGLVFNLSLWGELVLYGLAYLLIGGPVLIKAAKDSWQGQLFDENFLMTVSTLGAFAIQEFPEAVAVMLFYEIGELMQDLAVNKSRRSIKSLLDIKADYANLKQNEEVMQVTPDQLQVGDIIVVKPGEKVPVDGIVTAGASFVDTSALTGEAVNKKVETGAEVLSGFINQEGLLTIEVTSEFTDSTVARILNLVENAASKKAPTEDFITKLARYYTPAVVFGALGLAFIPPLVIAEASFSQWIYRALIFLVVSCPCALVVSIPLGFFGGIGAASRSGVLVKGGNYLEGLSKVKQVVFDKTGTLTEGVFEVQKIVPAAEWSKEQVLQIAAQVEANSNHPIAQSIVKAYSGSAIKQDQVSEHQQIAGRGIKAKIDNKEVLVGNQQLMIEENINYLNPETDLTTVHIAYNRNYIGYIIISDQIKVDAKEAVANLRKLGVETITMLTGDQKSVANQVANSLQLDDYYAELLPDQKVDRVEELLSDQGKLIFVGDGINDAPVLARSDIGVAMGGLGSEAAIEAADVVLMTDEPTKLVTAIKLANYTKQIVWQNIVLALGIKGLVLGLGAFGLATMWQAVFADVGVALLAVLNSLRVIRWSQKSNFKN